MLAVLIYPLNLMVELRWASNNSFEGVAVIGYPLFLFAFLNIASW